MNSFEYDTLEGIKGCLQSYEKFNDMLSERTKAGYRRRERLHTFHVLGRYMLDACGNVGVADRRGFIPAEKIKDFPPVVDVETYQDLLEEWDKENIPDVLTRAESNDPDFDYRENKRPYPTTVTFGMRNDIPKAHILCPFCGKGWDFDNCHDVKIFSDRHHDEKDTFVGMTLNEVRESHKKRSDATYSFYAEMHNKKFKDLAPHERFSDMVKNETGTFTPDDDYVISKGDVITYISWKHLHIGCVLKLAEIDCAEFLKNDGEGYYMGNHAGRGECNPFIKLELQLAGIDIIEKKGEGEVPYLYAGQMGAFSFRRAWTYWIVNGPVPLSLANKMYETEEGKKNVRVAGHCGCPPPEEWARPSDSKKGADRKIEWKTEPVIDTYHIDTWKGLKLFADTLRNVT